MSKFGFEITATAGRARTGRIQTAHGDLETPALIPVGTQATVKTLDVRDLQDLGAPAVLANTYHLYLRPGADLVERHGGLHDFMNWTGPIFTDSGGFQVFSLGFGLEHGVGKVANIFPDEDERRNLTQKPALMKIDEEGVNFRSHLDGSSHRLTAEKSIHLQQQLGADIILAFDECTSPLHDQAYTAAALERTHAWARRSLAAWTNRQNQALFAIVQGGAYRDLRIKSANFINDLDVPGVAIGGSLGKSKQDMYDILDWTLPVLDPARPRHLLGIGEISDLFAGSARGVDTFDCVEPTRLARNGTVYLTPQGGGSAQHKFRLNIAAAAYRDDPQPLDPGCTCWTCQHHSRAYLRHLFNAGEMLGPRLATIHNLHFMLRLMSEIRAAIGEQRLGQLAQQWGVTAALP
jgi:queuine tRNA-ribosyltransferase